MRLRHLAGLAAVATAFLGLPVPASALADASTIYVDDIRTANCSDAGSGTQQQPFCTIQAAADVVQPGQTVQVAPRLYRQTQVTLTHSGTPDKPITFRGGSIRSGLTGMAKLYGAGGGPTTLPRGFVLNSVHDVAISGFVLDTAGGGVVLNGTSRVTLDGNSFKDAFQNTAAELDVTGTSAATTISRNTFYTENVNSVVVEPGATGTVVTGNAIENAYGGGVQVTDAPGTVVTGNTVSTGCTPAVALLGNSSKAVVENNILAADSFVRSQAQCSSMSELAVSTASYQGTAEDYNLADPPLGQPAPYLQGAHDLTADPRYYSLGLELTEGSPAIDSADANAPGELSTDLRGYQRIDDPTVANTGTGTGVYDRGAYEYTPAAQAPTVIPSAGQLPVGAAVTFTVTSFNGWSSLVSYTYDFGDGTRVTTADSSASHTYTATGTYNVSVVAVLKDGESSATTVTDPMTVVPPGPFVAALAVAPNDQALGYTASATASSSWSISTYLFDFGDGTGQSGCLGFNSCEHTYHREGDYTVTLTVRDDGGNVRTAEQQVHVGYQPSSYYTLTPTRVLDTRNTRSTLGPGQTLTIPLLNRDRENLNPLPFDQTPDAVVLNVTAVAKDSAGFLTVYPADTDRPSTSNVNFLAGQAVPNLVTVPVGPDGVSVYNRFGDTDVVVDILGYYSSNPQTWLKYTAQAPVRLLDTRPNNPLGAGGETSVQIRGQHNVPTDATAVVLNVTATEPDSAGYFTVYPGGTARPGTSNVNFTAGQTVANQVIVPIGPDGTVKLYNFAGDAHAVVDLFGYYSPSGEALFQPVTPRRLLDTRPGNAIGSGGRLSVATGAPAGTTGAVLNITATEPTQPGFLTVWADGADRPGTSNLNFTAGQTVPNHVTTPVGADGAFDVYNFSGSTQVVADLFGYFHN
ncbi:PKD repeat protein [Kitasatospora sp. MAA4]|uniref:PKD domain-containing protein n=1 Tax=Kitasatospora sp. MAA4 TaxID=3035093 RepID=UPI002475A3D2|nr:PKD domain-containing protein [Kitasatospora sp. MAA4]MDH6132701.1 PKD repeat protein [Kitasatospora sp. MAA4]